MSKRLLLKTASAALAGALLHACGGGGGGDSGGGGGSGSLLQRLQQDSRFSLLLAALQRAGLTGALDAAGAGLTLFAPENSAFDALASRLGAGGGAGLVNTLTPAQWTDILHFAMLPQVLSLAALDNFAATDTRANTLYDFRSDTQQLIFVPGLYLWDGVGRTSITLPRGDVAASNGVLHVASDVLLPRGVLTVSQMMRASIDSFSDFAASITSQVPELDGGAAFTVFAPVNGVVTPPLSTNVVRHHVVPGELDSNAFPTSVVLAPLFGQALTLRRGSGAVVLATLAHGSSVKANVTDVDFFASNGVIHVIDSVILP